VSEDPMLGLVLGDRFEVVSLVGSGGMASVYRARDIVLDRVVAIKVFAVDTSEDRARLESEVRLLSRLNHPNLVTVHDAHLSSAVDDGPSFLVMEFVGGTTLREAIVASPLSADLIVAVASGIGEALHVVHEAGIVHRDVKPANILIEPGAPTTSGVRAKLADFGIAHSVGSSHLTATATVIGTAGYLSPEQAAGGTVTSASDVYSLGLVVLECFTGQMEYPGSAAESLAARLGRDPVLPPWLPAGWSALLGSMLARDPANRPSALEVARKSTRLSGELVGIHTATSADSAELAKTRVLPVGGATAPRTPTSATRVMTGLSGTSPPKSATTKNGRRQLPIRIALIALGAVLLSALVIAIVLAARPLAPVPSPSGTSSTSSPAVPAATATPIPTPTTPSAPAPGKGKDKGPGPGPGPGPGKNH
jgi:eukaryotic-like serine/threonine-protein kinase